VSEELSRWLFVWLTFLGAIIGLRDNAHLGTDMLVSRLGPLGKRVCLALSQVLMLVVTLVFAKGSWVQLKINLDVEAPVTGASMAWVYGAGLVFSAAASALLATKLWHTLSGRLSDADLVMVQESEDLPHPSKDNTP
jgi:TRAP-type C4-dicarboxylate transport system permease small subunit